MKKFLSVLVLTLIVVLINPCIVHAADDMDNPSYTFMDADGNSHSTKASGKAKVLIFGREACGNTAYTLRKLKDKQREHSKFDILLIDIDSSDSDSLKSYAGNYVVSGLSFVTSDDASYAMWNYVDKFHDVGNGGSVGLPIVVYINADNKLVDCTSGPIDIDVKAGELFGYESEEDAEANSLVEFSINVTYNQTEARKMLDSINDFRQNDDDAWYWNYNNTQKVYCPDLKPLEYDCVLEKIAMQRAAEIAVNYSHERPDGTYVFSMLDGYTSSGENIAYGYWTSKAVFNAWREDNEEYSGQGHRRNILDSSYNRVGIACVLYEDVKFWVQVFGKTTNALPAITTANNNHEDVVVKALGGNIKYRDFYTQEYTYSVKEGQCININLPKAYIALNESIFYCPINTETTYSISNTDVATLKDSELCGVAVGTTFLKVNADIAGKNVEQSYNVSVESNVVEHSYGYRNLSYTFPAADGTTVTTTATDRPKVLIFYHESCGPCTELFRDISGSPDKYSGVDVVAIDIYGSDIDNINDYASSFGEAPITFCSGNDDVPFEYARLWDNSSSLSLGTPFVVFIDKNNVIVYKREGYVNYFADYMDAFDSGDWDNVALNSLIGKDKSEGNIKEKEEQSSIDDEQDSINNNYAQDQQKEWQAPVAPNNNNIKTDSKNIVKNEEVYCNEDNDEVDSSSKKSNKPVIGSIKKLSITNNNKKTTLKWKKVKKASGYQIQISTNKKFKKAKTITVKGSKTSYTTTKIKNGTTYIRVRAYRKYKDSKKKNKKAYGDWMYAELKIY